MGIVKNAKEELKNKQKEEREKMKPKHKETIETLKTIAITALIVAIIAFVGGVYYQKSVNNETKSAVLNAVSSVTSKD